MAQGLKASDDEPKRQGGAEGQIQKAGDRADFINHPLPFALDIDLHTRRRDSQVAGRADAEPEDRDPPGPVKG